MEIVGNSQRGGAKCIVRFWGGGGKRTMKCPLQTQFLRPQKVGFVWSVPVSCKENDIARTEGGESYHKWGVQNCLGEGLYGMFSPPLSFPPVLVFSEIGQVRPRKRLKELRVGQNYVKLGSK